MKKSSTVFVGMDVHKESIDITLAEVGGEVRRYGQIGGDRVSLSKMVRKLQSKKGERVFVYEAGPCGFWIYRDITALARALHGGVAGARSAASGRSREDRPARQRAPGEPGTGRGTGADSCARHPGRGDPGPGARA